jgi:hypothetical protein
MFGALVDEYTGETGEDIWKIGEDIYTPGTPGDALRYMNDPERGDDFDWYPTRYTGAADNGGVHWNSGIANLAFYLLVTGGTHPREKSEVVVDGIGFDAAAYIFYHANTNCLTPSSTFQSARYCTAEVHGGIYKENVHAAWDAVGVPRPPPVTPWAYEFILKTDSYPAETSWTITDDCDDGKVVMSGSDYTQKEEENAYYLQTESKYTLTVNDEYGDGICCNYGSGFFTLTDKDGLVVTSGTSFGSSASKTFGECAIN